MAWKLLLFYLDKLTLSELQIQGPLWPFIMKKSISTLQVSHNFAAAFGCHHLQFQNTMVSATYRKSSSNISEKWFWICTWQKPFQRNSKTCSKLWKILVFPSRENVYLLACFSYEFENFLLSSNWNIKGSWWHGPKFYSQFSYFLWWIFSLSLLLANGMSLGFLCCSPPTRLLMVLFLVVREIIHHSSVQKWEGFTRKPTVQGS